MRFPLLRIALSSTVAMSIGCGDDVQAGPDSGDPVACAAPLGERLLPLSVGVRWTYDVTDLSAPGAPTVNKLSTVEAFEDVGARKAGTSAFRLRTEKASGETVSWQEDRCTAIVRHREQSFGSNGTMESDQFYMPGKLRVDESPAHLTVGARWTVSYEELEVDPVAGESRVSKDETWSVEAVDESITVPAGTFVTVQLRKVTSGDADKRFWFAAGVGKVKEQGEQLEVLRDYQLP
jgi:hypothetical protein